MLYVRVLKLKIGKMEMPTLKRCYNFVVDNIFSTFRRCRKRPKETETKSTNIHRTTKKKMNALNLFWVSMQNIFLRSKMVMVTHKMHYKRARKKHFKVNVPCFKINNKRIRKSFRQTKKIKLRCKNLIKHLTRHRDEFA